MQLMLHPAYIGGFSILQPWPKEKSRLTVVIRPFDNWAMSLLIIYFANLKKNKYILIMNSSRLYGA